MGFSFCCLRSGVPTAHKSGTDGVPLPTAAVAHRIPALPLKSILEVDLLSSEKVSPSLEFEGLLSWM